VWRIKAGLLAVLLLLVGCADRPVPVDRALPQPTHTAEPGYNQRAYLAITATKACTDHGACLPPLRYKATEQLEARLEQVATAGFVYVLQASGLGDQEAAERISPFFMEAALADLMAQKEPLHTTRQGAKMQLVLGVAKESTREILARHYRLGIEQDVPLAEMARMTGAFEDIDPLLGDYLRKVE
jgi:hypothetical protein